LEILSESPENSTGIVLYDNPLLLKGAKQFKKKLLTFGFSPEADVCIVSEKQSQDGMDIIFKIRGVSLSLILPVYHESYALNAASALAAGLALNLDISECIKGLSRFSGLKGRYNIRKTPEGKTIIDDSYNASPESMKAGLVSVFKSFPNKKTLLILGDMRELGELSEQAHKGLAPYCMRLNPVYLLTVGKFSKLIASESIKLGMNPQSTLHFENVEDLLKEVKGLVRDADVVYIKGSLAIQLGKIVEELHTTR
jgi:UDP-N-acetylmuramoyl-tripeptide--D-alanyl-D-alanine ligase